MPTAAKKTTASGDVTERMQVLLMDRADALMGCTENSPEEVELAALTDVIEAYGIPGGKGWRSALHPVPY